MFNPNPAAGAQALADRLTACALCSHGSPAGCVSPDVTGGRGAVPFHEARRVGGPCGPEALRFYRPGWTEAECSGALPPVTRWNAPGSARGAS